MKKPLSIIIILLIGFSCIGQEKEQSKRAFTYSVGLAYNQVWLPSYMYGANEYSTWSSPYNWGISPFFSMRKNRWEFSFSCSYMSFSRKEQFSETRFLIDNWQEASLASALGFRVTGEHSLIKVTPFLGLDLSYLINYNKVITYGGSHTWHYNTDQLGARYSDYYSLPLQFPLGIGLLGRVDVSCPIAKHFEVGFSYCFKFKIHNDIRSDHNPHFPAYVTSPRFYHNASIGVEYCLN